MVVLIRSAEDETFGAVDDDPLFSFMSLQYSTGRWAGRVESCCDKEKMNESSRIFSTF
jgi:hypothetical protein